MTATTRPPRPGERDGIDYHFLDAAAFERQAVAGGFLEHARVFSHRYGTPRAPVEAGLARGEVLLLPIDVQGARQVRASMPGALFVFLLPPDEASLASRLAGRGTEDAARQAERLRVARGELACRSEYDHGVVNDDLDRAAADLASLVMSRRQGA